MPRRRTRPQVADWGVGAYCTAFPLIQVALVAEGFGGSYTDAGWALAATAAFLPLHLRHVAHAIRGERPAHGGWTLAAMTALVVAALPVVGSQWLPTFHVLVVSGIIVLRPRWSLLLAAAVVAAQAPLAEALGSALPAAPSYYTLTVVWRSAAVIVPVWLVATVRQLQAAHRALADEAVVRERVRIDEELRRTLGTALDAIVRRGRRAADAVGPDGDADEAARELRALVDGSRRALADARHIISGYRQATLQAEVELAATLLTAAGVRARVELPAEPLPEAADEGVRAALRSATAELLRDRSARAATIEVRLDGGRVELAVRREDAGVPSQAARR